jgi:hypothetical protein
MLFPEGATPSEKSEIIKEKINAAIKQYPKQQTAGSFTILYACRDDYKDLHCFCFEWAIKTGLSVKKIDLPRQSNVIAVFGSGAKEFMDRFEADFNHSKYNNFGTSRTVYHCFTETLKHIKDPQCGGAPQIVGLYRIGNAINYGIIDKGKRFLAGSEVGDLEFPTFVEWRNENFERVEPQTMQIIGSAQRQPKI